MDDKLDKLLSEVMFNRSIIYLAIALIAQESNGGVVDVPAALFYLFSAFFLIKALSLWR